MTRDDKAAMVQSILGDDYIESDAIATLLDVAGRELIAWRYSNGSAKLPEEVPEEYEMAQVFAVIAGYTQRGAEGQTYHAENGITRTFAHSDMVDYIRKHVIPLCGVPS